jgi:hypothetical protein
VSRIVPPTPTEALARIHAAESLAISGASIDEIAEAVRLVHRGCTIPIYYIEPGIRFFRAVRANDFPDDESNVSYPPAKFCKTLGRANSPGRPMFYASMADRGPLATNSMLVCVWESKAEDDEMLAIGEWEVAESIYVYPFGYQAAAVQLRAAGKAPWISSAEPADTMKVIQDWETEVFTRAVAAGNEDEFLMSVALTKFALDQRGYALPGSDGVHGIMYPSVACGLGCDNICITPEAVDTRLRLLGVRIISARNIETFAALDVRPEGVAIGRADVTFHHASHPCDGSGSILWPGRVK